MAISSKVCCDTFVSMPDRCHVVDFVQEDLDTDQAQPCKSSRASANIVHSLAVDSQGTGSASRKRKSGPAETASGSNDDFRFPMPERGCPSPNFPPAFNRAHTGNEQHHCLAEAAPDH